MKVTKKEFAHIAREAVYEAVDKVADEHTEVDDTMETIISLAAVQFIKNVKQYFFDESDEVDFNDEDDFDNTLAEISSKIVATELLHADTDDKLGFASVLIGILCTIVNADIGSTIRKKIFKEED